MNHNDSGNLVVDAGKPSGLNGVVYGNACAGGQYVPVAFGKFLNNSLDLQQGFSFTVNDFRRAVSNTSMMIDAGKSDILKRQTFEKFHRRIRADPAVFNFLDQCF